MKVNINNTEKMLTLLDSVESGKRVRLLSLESIEKYVEAAEEKLASLGVLKKYWLDCSIYVYPESVPKNYKYVAHGTCAVIRRFETGWFLVRLARFVCSHTAYGSPKGSCVILAELAKNNLPTKHSL